MIAVTLTVFMYFAIVYSFAELSTIIPTAGGGYGFARCAFGPSTAFLTGIAILIQYTSAAAIVSMFIAYYLSSLIGVGGWPVHLGAYVILIGVHSLGVGDALKMLLGLTAGTINGLLLFVVAILPHFELSNLFDIAPNDSLGASVILPYGYVGIWAALPFASAFFLAIEGLPMASEEADDPATGMPKAMIIAMIVLFVFSMLLMVFGVAGGGADVLKGVGNPLVVALNQAMPDREMTVIVETVNVAALIGLVGGMFAAVYAYSRQLFALSRAGYLPRYLSLTNSRRAPIVALIVPGLIGFLLTLTGAANEIYVVMVFAATFSYLFMLAAHIKLRVSARDVKRPYSTPGGTLTSGFALLMSILLFVACFVANVYWSIMGSLVLVSSFAYFLIFRRNKLVSDAPEEELALIMAAQSDDIS